jgi:hypothetical protein
MRSEDNYYCQLLGVLVKVDRWAGVALASKTLDIRILHCECRSRDTGGAHYQPYCIVIRLAARSLADLGQGWSCNRSRRCSCWEVAVDGWVKEGGEAAVEMFIHY